MAGRCGIIAAIFGAGLSVLTSAPIWAADLMSFEAVYDLRLSQASSSGGPRAATGIFETRFVETCTGWDLKSHTVLSLAFSVGPDITNERFFSSWEAKNGNDYTFAAQMLKNGRLAESYKGSAAVSKRGGKAKYEVPATEEKGKPRVVTLNLPQGTLFPAAYSQALLGGADQGQPFFSRVVLNGASTAGPRMLSTAIGPRRVNAWTENTSGIDNGLLQTASWRMSSAYFNFYEKRDLPNTEIFLQIYKTGITESFDQRFGDFIVSAKLQRLRRIDPPRC
jgi:hypothetical protein